MVKENYLMLYMIKEIENIDYHLNKHAKYITTDDTMPKIKTKF